MYFLIFFYYHDYAQKLQNVLKFNIFVYLTDKQNKKYVYKMINLKYTFNKNSNKLQTV